MKLFAVRFVALALSLGLLTSTTVNADDKMTKDIVDTAIAGKFTTLVEAVKAAELVETLKGKGPFTVFAPTDEAFKKIPEADLKALLKDKDKLKKVLLAHVVVGKAVMAADVVGMDGKEVNGFKIAVKGKAVSLGNAGVIKTDIKTSNGVIHVIDTVLMPK